MVHYRRKELDFQTLEERRLQQRLTFFYKAINGEVVVTTDDLGLEVRVGKFYPHVVLTMVKTPVKTGLGKTPKTHMNWAKLGKTNFLNSKNASCFHILYINL